MIKNFSFSLLILFNVLILYHITIVVAILRIKIEEKQLIFTSFNITMTISISA